MTAEAIPLAAEENWAGPKFTRPGPEPECPYELWGGYGHSEPLGACPGDREREAG